MNILFIKITLLLYLLGTVVFWFYLSRRSKVWFKYSLAISCSGLLFHTLSILSRVVEGGYFPLSRLYESVNFFCWALVVAFLGLGYKHKTHSFGLFILPFVFVVLSVAMLLPKMVQPLDPVLRSKWFAVHTTLSVMGFVCFAVAFVSGLMYLVQDRLLKAKKLTLLFQKLPPLNILDEINQKSISIGFPFLTLGIMSGFLWGKAAWGVVWTNDPKMLFAIFTWFFYLMVLHGRYTAGWRSKKAAYLSVIGFVCVLSIFILIAMLSGDGRHSFT